MSKPSTDKAEVPVWARAEAFPAKPTHLGECGFIDAKGNAHSAQNEEELARKIEHASWRVDLVWTAGSDKLVVPEELGCLQQPLRARFGKQAQKDIS
ncbi:MAG: hypothetical protein ACPIA7_02010, partial [Akkermansiaceae bacterium]